MVRHVLREPPTGPTTRKEELLVSILWIIIIVIIVLFGARLLRPRQVPPLEASWQHGRKEEFVPGKFVVKPGSTGKYRFNLLSRRDT